MNQKKRKQLINFIFWSAGYCLLRVEGFSCSLDVLYEGLGISKLLFLKKDKNFFAVFFPFLVIKTLVSDTEPAADPDPDSIEMLDPDPYLDPESQNRQQLLQGRVM
jgi:hypothetical protein